MLVCEMRPDLRGAARARKSARWNSWPEDAWIVLDSAFWGQRPEAILDSLLYGGPDPGKVDNFRKMIEGGRHFPGVFANHVFRLPRPLVLRRVREMYLSATNEYRRICAAWRAQLPRLVGEGRMQQARRAAAPVLRAQLQAAFPRMSRARLDTLVNGTVERGGESGDTRNVPDAIQGHVGEQLKTAWSSARVRHAVARASHLGPHGLDSDAEKGLKRFRRWIRTQPKLRAPYAFAAVYGGHDLSADDVDAGIGLILEARELAAPRPEFYIKAAPLYFERACFERRLKPDPHVEDMAERLRKWAKEPGSG
jgi:hypothetical protein